MSLEAIFYTNHSTGTVRITPSSTPKMPIPNPKNSEHVALHGQGYRVDVVKLQTYMWEEEGYLGLHHHVPHKITGVLKHRKSEAEEKRHGRCIRAIQQCWL